MQASGFKLEDIKHGQLQLSVWILSNPAKQSSIMLRTATLAAALFVGFGAAHAVAPTAQIKNGSYVGTYSPEYDQDFFLGIPYAQPPVGSLRFRKPVSLNTTWEHAKPATQYSPEVLKSFHFAMSLLTRLAVLRLRLRPVELSGMCGPFCRLC